MPAVKIAENVYWVGAVDWNIRYFHGPAYSTHRGTTYNAYLILDEKITLIDTVYKPFTDELFKNISEIVDPTKIDYVVVNHIESDHSGALPALMEHVPNAKIFCSARAKDGLLQHYFGDWDYNIVKTGDELSLGQYTLNFIEAPMLHWPDSMFTYLKELELLMPNDAFGQHLASSHRFNDEEDLPVLMEEAAKYYANILYPFSDRVLKKIDEVVQSGIPIKMIAPSHGTIWRTNPMQIVEAYQAWASGKAEPKAVIAYDTMWESTHKMALALLDGLKDEGVKGYLFKLSVSDRNDVVKELLNAKAILVGSPTINNDILPNIAPLLDDLKGLKPKNKIGFAFGSYGWGGGAVKTIAEKLKAAGLEQPIEPFQHKWVPDGNVLTKCRELGRELATKIKA